VSSDELSHADYLRLVNSAAGGKRPLFFDHPDTDRLISIILALAGELAVTRERLDTVERLLANKRLLQPEEIDGYRPDDVAAEARGRWHLEYLARVFRVLQQEVESLQRGAQEASAEQVAREIATQDEPGKTTDSSRAR
jgi:hypothetical protein